MTKGGSGKTATPLTPSLRSGSYGHGVPRLIMKENGIRIKGTTGRIKKEWKRVVWPDTADVRSMTAAAIAVTAAVGIAAAAVDAGMMALINMLIGII